MAVVLATVMAAGAGCKRQGGASTASTSAASEPALIASAPAPAGMAFERVTRPFGTLEVPAGAGWTRETGEVFAVSNEATGVTVMVQEQPGIEPAQRDEYVTSFIGANRRDAPQYAVTEQRNGSVAGHAATRVDGRFDNGTAMSTRDYVVFAAGHAIAVMARGPAPRAAEVRAIIDHVASTLAAR